MHVYVYLFQVHDVNQRLKPSISSESPGSTYNPPSTQATPLVLYDPQPASDSSLSSSEIRLETRPSLNEPVVKMLSVPLLSREEESDFIHNPDNMV